ncbi:MAG: ATP-binding protein [Chloroflexota bacterium]
MASGEDRPGSRHDICVASEATNLARIAEFVGDRARLAGLDDDRVFEIQMAVDEACTNAISHAYQGQGDGLVYICCYEEGSDFVVSVTDHGRPFDPNSVPAPRLDAPLEKREIGGLGLYLMRQMTDSIAFSFDERLGNRVVMHKHRKVRPSERHAPL